MASSGTAGIAALGDDPHDDIVHPSAILFVAAHLACLAAFWTGVTIEALTLGVTLYFLRMFAITAASRPSNMAATRPIFLAHPRASLGTAG